MMTLNDHVAAAWALVERLGGDVRRRYAEENHRAHYQRVAERLYGRKADDALCKAALLHGVRPAELRAAGEPVEPAVLRILDDHAKLVAFKHREGGGGRQEIPAPFRALDPAAVLLFVTEQLDRLDPDDALGQWTRDFSITPRPLPEALRRTPEAAPAQSALELARTCVAPLAGRWGMWPERNTAENAAFFYDDHEGFVRVSDFVLAAGPPGERCQKILDELDVPRFARVVVAGDPDLGVTDIVLRWEWRHVASMAARLGPRKQEADWEKKIERCGFATLICTDHASCYATLCKLHEQFEHIDADLRDFTGRLSPSRYRALHTVVKTAGHDALAVRILARTEDAHRFAPAGGEYVADMRKRGTVSPKIRVYTPQHEAIELPEGATVLNFAYHVHQDFVTRIDHAVLNGRQRVEKFHRLNHGDEVHLELRERPEPLPEGWEQLIPQETVTKIGKVLKSTFKPHLEAEGRRWIRKKLARRIKLAQALDDNLLDLLLEDASCVHFRRKLDEKVRSANHWLEKFGRLATGRRGNIRTDLNEPLVNRFFDIVLERCALLTLRSEVDLPEPPHGGAESIVRCPLCKKDWNNKAELGVTVQDRVLTVHVMGRECARGARPLNRREQLENRTFFVIETGNRKGIASEILAEFRHADVDVVEVVGRRFTKKWGGVRIEASRLGINNAERIAHQIQRIGDVARVVQAGEGEIVRPVEDYLPPRRPPMADPWSDPRPDPYFCGDWIDDDRFFYGRRNELSLLDEQRSLAGGAGTAAFVCGPLKVGKTSLVKRFLRDRKRASAPCFTAYHWVLAGETLPDVELRLCQALRKDVEETRKHHNLPYYDLPQGGGLESLLAALSSGPRWMPLVLVIDEAVGLFESVQRRREDTYALLRLWRTIKEMPGALLVWVGPRAPVRRLADPLQSMLRAAKEIVLSPFQVEDVQNLLEARKLRPMVNIRVSESIAEEVLRLTGGNPYWIGYLASLMWRRLRYASAGRVTRDQVDRARKLMIVEPLPFRQVTGEGAGDPSTWSVAAQHRWIALSALSSPAVAEVGLNTRQVVDRLQEATKGSARPISRVEADELLAELLAAGAAVEPAPGRICIAAQLLAEHINTVNDT